MNNKEFWNKHYKKHKLTRPSNWAKICLPRIKGSAVELGCGGGRDLYFFRLNGIDMHGVDGSNEDLFIIRQDVEDYIKENKSPTNVYTRFFWHAIPRETQLAILKWTKKRIFIEARTILDKPKNLYGKHKRYLVNPSKLTLDLVEHGFKIIQASTGRGLSPYRDEDPHLVRIIAEK